MLINIRVNDEKQALKFINDVLADLGKDETENIHYADEEIQIAPEVRAKHSSEGPSDITIENYLNLSITVGDLDFTTQSVINKHKNMLHRL
jgi:hypothetical protein